MGRGGAGVNLHSKPAGSAGTLSRGPGRLLIAVYGVFALAATARAAFQIATKFSEAPLAYTLTAFAALVYVFATVSLSRSGRRWYRLSVAAVGIELVGVLTIGTLSVVDPVLFPADTVWSVYGRGYGFVPLILPVLGLWWLYRHRRTVAT
ncbi:membrane protein [Arthrobacter parietis]|uniref:Membrane protein n=1 Tax=Arthrobacter parietis TaxID=271434 RepID=A0ABN3B2A8_9MICC